MQEDNNQQAGWAFKPEVSSGASQPMPSSQTGGEKVAWSASEYVANPRGTTWFIGLAGLSLLIATIIYLVSSDWISTIAILVLGIAVGVFSSRKPRVLEYSVDQKGIQVGDKHYPYAMFRSFSIMEKGIFGSIYLMPLKRFMPPIEAHFDLKDQPKITAVLGDYLPFEERSPDFVDTLSDRLRF